MPQLILVVLGKVMLYCENLKKKKKMLKQSLS